MTNNTLLTAYNKDIQRFMMYADRSTTEKKKTFLEAIEDAVISAGKSFERLFPAKTKRQAILDEIIFMLSGSGICKVESKTLAEKTDSSVRTVSDAVKNIKETGQILVAGMSDGKNKYVFVLKSHPNFKQIMKEVFFIENADDISGQIAEQENAETVEAVSVEGQKTSPNYTNSFNLLSSKQESNIYIAESIENEAISVNKDPEKEAEYISTYYVSEFQKMVYDHITADDQNFHDSIKDSALIIGLRVGSNSDHKNAVKAIQTVIKIDMFIKRGGVVREGIPALFSKVYQHGLDMWEYERQYKQQNPPQPRRVAPVPFYNWLEERD